MSTSYRIFIWRRLHLFQLWAELQNMHRRDNVLLSVTFCDRTTGGVANWWAIVCPRTLVEQGDKVLPSLAASFWFYRGDKNTKLSNKKNKHNTVSGTHAQWWTANVVNLTRSQYLAKKVIIHHQRGIFVGSVVPAIATLILQQWHLNVSSHLLFLSPHPTS